MTGRALTAALVASLVIVVVGAIVNDAFAVTAGMISTLAAGLCLAVKTDDTTQPMHDLLYGERRV